LSLIAVTSVLRERGWIPAPYTQDGIPWFNGVLNTIRGPVECRLGIPDEDLVRLPIIILKKRPPYLPPVVPHLSADNELCYAAKGTLVLNPITHGDSVLYCIAQAEEVMNRTFTGRSFRDFNDEFMMYWGLIPAFVDLPLEGLALARAFRANNEKCTDPLFIAIGKDFESISQRLPQDRYALLNEPGAPVYVLNTSKRPGAIEGHWPPQSIRQFLNWLRRVDSHCAGKARRAINYFAGRNSWFILLIRTPQAWPGVFIAFPKKPPIITGRFKSQKSKQIKAWIEQSLVFPLNINRIDSAFIAQRNRPGEPTLLGRRIALVGCGTIGGYLADLLVRAGAGSDGGELRLVDPDHLTAANLGRHRLGLPFLEINKAEAVATQLAQDFPGINLRALPVDIREAHLGSVELVIDATGDEAIAMWMAQHFGRFEQFVPILHTWIEGAGVSVRSLLRDIPEAGCYMCFRSGVRETGSFGLSSLNDPNALIHRADGCDSVFVPFSGSISLQAAALAMDSVMAWVRGTSGARLHTRVLDNSLGRPVPEQNLIHQDGCLLRL